jgi:hypothetical protein
MFAPAGRCNHLLDMLRMRCRENDGLDLVVIEHCIEIAQQSEIVFLRESLDVVAVRASRSGDELQLVTVTRYCLDERATPPAKSNDACLNHCVPSLKAAQQ